MDLALSERCLIAFYMKLIMVYLGNYCSQFYRPSSKLAQ
jgi:hypothetical protein